MSTGELLALIVFALFVAVIAERDVFHCRQRRRNRLPEDIQ